MNPHPHQTPIAPPPRDDADDDAITPPPHDDGRWDDHPQGHRSPLIIRDPGPEGAAAAGDWVSELWRELDGRSAPGRTAPDPSRANSSRPNPANPNAPKPHSFKQADSTLNPRRAEAGAPATLPELTPTEGAYLSAFLHLGCLHAAAAALELLPTALARFLSQPHIRAYMAFTDSLYARRDCRESLDALRNVLTLDNPIESRRAASTIVRYYTPCRAIPPRLRRNDTAPAPEEGAEAQRHKATEWKDTDPEDKQAAPDRAMSSPATTRPRDHATTSQEGAEAQRHKATEWKDTQPEDPHPAPNRAMPSHPSTSQEGTEARRHKGTEWKFTDAEDKQAAPERDTPSPPPTRPRDHPTTRPLQHTST